MEKRVSNTKVLVGYLEKKHHKKSLDSSKMIKKRKVDSNILFICVEGIVKRILEYFFYYSSRVVGIFFG